MIGTDAPIRIGKAALPQTESSAIVWIPSKRITYTNSETLEREIAKVTPANAQLIQFTDTHKPPQSWFDEDTNPFLAD